MGDPLDGDGSDGCVADRGLSRLRAASGTTVSPCLSVTAVELILICRLGVCYVPPRPRSCSSAVTPASAAGWLSSGVLFKNLVESLAFGIGLVARPRKVKTAPPADAFEWRWGCLALCRPWREACDEIVRASGVE